MNYLYPFITESKLKLHENVCKHHNYYLMIIPEEDNNILKYNQDKKFLKTLFIIYEDTESLLEKSPTCYNNSDETSTEKISKHTACSY